MTEQSQPSPQTGDPAWLVEYAVLAPSSHNTQPWCFAVSGNTICLRADRTRALPANDPADRELTISCGCALMNLRVTASHANRPYTTRITPDPADRDLLAVVKTGTNGAPCNVESELFPLIPKRRTHRKPFDSKAVSEDILACLSEAAQQEGAWMEFITSNEKRAAVAKLVADGDSIQWANPRWRRELAAWMHSKRKKDGLTVPGLVAPAARIVVRTFDMGNRVSAKDKRLAEEAPVLAVLGTSQDDMDAWMHAGQALERVLLVGCQEGVQASYLNQPIQVDSLRPKVQNLLANHGFPQILLRLGHHHENIPTTPRRDVLDVLESA